MHSQLRHCRRLALSSLITLGVAFIGIDALATEVYTPITPTMSDQTISLDGHHLTVEQIVKIAR